MKRELSLSVAFLVVFVVLHWLSDVTGAQLPVLAKSESVWEHFKMAFWAWGLVYAAGWGLSRRGALLGLFVGTLFCLAGIFTVYYGVIAITGPLSNYPLPLHLAVNVGITLLGGWFGAVAALYSERAREGRLLWVSGAIWALLLLLFVVFTYVSPPLLLFVI